jgi:hypothetical protein
MTAFSELPEIVLKPLAGRPDADWYKAPPGKWNAAQIVEHLALGLEWSSKGFDDRRARDPMARRRRTLYERVARFLIMGLGWFPPFRKAPSKSVPAEQVLRAHAETHFLEGIKRTLEMAKLLLPARAHDLFVKHPRMGDLTLEEWMEFHVRHAKHHAKQIRQRAML